MLAFWSARVCRFIRFFSSAASSGVFRPARSTPALAASIPMPQADVRSTAKSDTVTSMPIVAGRWLSVRRLLVALLALETISYLSLQIGAVVPLARTAGLRVPQAVTSTRTKVGGINLDEKVNALAKRKISSQLPHRPILPRASMADRAETDHTSGLRGQLLASWPISRSEFCAHTSFVGARPSATADADRSATRFNAGVSVRIQAKRVLIPMLLLGCAAADEEVHRGFVQGTKITLKARKAQYFLGENILLDYQIDYDGEAALEVGTITGLGSTDCRVIVLDSTGKKAPASTRPFHSTGQSGIVLRRGESERFTIPLSYYCRLEKPGEYRIRAAHNLLWTKRDIAIAGGDPRWAETTIEVSMPDDAQAHKVIEQMLRAKEDVRLYQRAYCTWKTNDYADFACLRYPIYLPILENMAGDAHGDQRALIGIAHNPTPEATQALLRLLKIADRDHLKRIVAALCDRLPEPNGVNRRDRRHPIQTEVAEDTVIDQRDTDPILVKGSWRDDFSAPMRQFARMALADDDPKLVQCAAYVLEALGVQEDMPALVATVSRQVPIVERTKPPQYIGEVAPVRQACMEATSAIEALAARGVDPQFDPQTPGAIIHFVSMLKQRKEFRPEDWEKRCQGWVLRESPYVREFVLFNSPRPLPTSLVDTYREGSRKVIVTTRDQTTIHAAVRSALDLKVPVDDLLGMLVDRLDSKEPPLYHHLFSCLGDVLETGKHEHANAACARTPNEKEMVAVKARWKSFLQDQGHAIRNGKRFGPNSPEFHRLMDPDPDEER